MLTLPTGSLENVPLLENAVEAMHECVPHVWEATTDGPQGARILLAEDGFDNGALIQTVLRMAGITVEAVENGRLAVDKALSEPFDLILMDMNMPEMDGYEATRLLRQSGYEKPILALTANAMSGDSDLCLSAGCNGYMSKPINRIELIRTITRLVGKEVADSQQTTPTGQDGSTAAAADSSASPPETETQIPSPPLADVGESTPHEDIIISQFIDDPDIAPIIGGFVERLAGQLDAMRQVWDHGEHEQLRRLAQHFKRGRRLLWVPLVDRGVPGAGGSRQTTGRHGSRGGFGCRGRPNSSHSNGCAAGATTGETSP